MSATDKVYRLIEESRALERSGNLAAAIDRAGQSRRLAQDLADPEGEAEALNALAYAHARLGHYELAKQFYLQALGLAGAESCARVNALLGIGICAGETDSLSLMESYTQQAVDLSRQIGYDQGLVRGLHSLSCGVYMPRGQFAVSIAADEEAFKIARARGVTELTWGPLLTMSWVHWLAGQPNLAEARLCELRQVVTAGSLGDGYWHFIRASLALEAGDVDAARELFARTLSIAEANGVAENLFLGRLGMSRLSRVVGDAPAALAWASEALAIMERSGYQHLQAQALIERSRAAWLLGNLGPAEDDLRVAIRLLAPQQLNFDLSIAALLLAALLRQQNRPEAPTAWKEAALRLAQGGFVHLVERERPLAFPMLVAGLDSQDASIVEASTALLNRLQLAPAPPLNITTLGGWRVLVGGRLVDNKALRQRRSGELLGLLLISPAHTVTFDQALEALWPEKDPAAAQPLFHHATSTLRRALEPDLPEKFPSRYLEVADGQVRLCLPPHSIVDYEVFLSHCRHAEWPAALDVWSGELLPMYPYANWILPQRQWLAQNRLRALVEAARIWLEEKRYVEAVDACRSALEIEPWHEPAVLLGMRACLATGDRPGALRLYKVVAQSLRDELGVEPQAELQALFHSLTHN
jgi:DNA-binding SARP family transcriptional activator